MVIDAGEGKEACHFKPGEIIQEREAGLFDGIMMRDDSTNLAIKQKAPGAGRNVAREGDLFDEVSRARFAAVLQASEIFRRECFREGEQTPTLELVWHDGCGSEGGPEFLEVFVGVENKDEIAAALGRVDNAGAPRGRAAIDDSKHVIHRG